MLIKNRLLYGLVAVSLVGLAACSEEETPDFNNSATGNVNISVAINKDVAESGGSRAGDAFYHSGLQDSDLQIRLFDDNHTYDRTWSYADFPENLKVKTGRYTVEAFYGDPSVDGFENPYFYGSTTISVEQDQSTTATLRAQLANSMVSVEYTEAFRNYFTDWSASVESANLQTVRFEKDETRPAYIAAGNAKLSVTFTKPNGTSATLQPATIDAKPRHHYRMTFDVNNGAAGDAALVVTFDDMLAQEDFVIDLSDELMNSPAPSITLAGFPADRTLSVVEGDPFATDLLMTVMARGVIGEVNLRTNSAWLEGKGWSKDVDLATQPRSNVYSQNGLQAEGVYATNLGKMARLNFQEVVSSLRYVEGQSNENTFSVQVKDRFTKTCDPEQFTVVVNKLVMSLSEGSIREGESRGRVNMAFNGSDVSGVVLQYQKDAATWVDLPYTASALSYGSPAMHSGAADVRNYRLDFNVPEGLTRYVLRAVYSGDIFSSAVNVAVTKRDFRVLAHANDIWAKKATFTVSSNDESVNPSSTIVSTITVRLKKEGDSDFSTVTAVTKDGNRITVAGLAPSSNYTLYAYHANDASRDCLPISFTTEADKQLPNGNLDTWSETPGGNNWSIFYPGASAESSVWGTNNPMTTSRGSDLAYCRISGTIPSTDSRSGKAALIRTVGWGPTNSATGSMSSGIMSYGDPGLLHLGASRTDRPSNYGDREGPLTTDDLNCGIAFASRPQSMSFWYKYSPKNSADKGCYEVRVVDASGSIIASATGNLDAKSAYTQVNVPLSYTAGCGKAAKIYVKFLSSNNRSYLSKNSSNFTPPPFANLSDGTYMGSQLYVDDVTLNY